MCRLNTATQASLWKHHPPGPPRPGPSLQKRTPGTNYIFAFEVKVPRQALLTPQSRPLGRPSSQRPRLEAGPLPPHVSVAPSLRASAFPARLRPSEAPAVPPSPPASSHAAFTSPSGLGGPPAPPPRATRPCPSPSRQAVTEKVVLRP